MQSISIRIPKSAIYIQKGSAVPRQNPKRQAKKTYISGAKLLRSLSINGSGVEGTDANS
jgi:hypothetical protein